MSGTTRIREGDTVEGTTAAGEFVTGQVFEIDLEHRRALIFTPEKQVWVPFDKLTVRRQARRSVA